MPLSVTDYTYEQGGSVTPSRPAARKLSATKGKSEFAIFSTLPNMDWLAQPPQPPNRPPTPQRAAATMRGDDGIEQTKINWQNVGFEVQPPQPPHPAPEKRAAAIMPRDDGAELPEIRWLNVGWEIAPYQPPHRGNERKAGAVMPKEDGIELTLLPRWLNYGWEVQPVYPPHFRPEQRFAAIVPKEDGVEAPLIRWLNFGFEVQAVQPPNPYTANLSSNNVKFAATVGGDSGIEAPFIPPAAPVTSGWGFDPTLPLLVSYPRTAQRYAAIKGKAEFAIFPNFNPAGWEIAPPLFRRVQPKLGTIARGDDGTQAAFIPPPAPVTSSWGFNPPDPYFPKINMALRGAGASGQSVFAAFTSQPWFDGINTNTDQKLIRRVNIEAIAAGIEGKFAPPIVITSGWGFDPQPFQPPWPGAARRSLFVPASGTIAHGGDGIEFPLINFYPVGFEVQAVQPPHRRTERAGAIMPIEPGIEAAFVFVPLAPLATWAFEAYPVQPTHPRPERFGAIVRGDDGIEQTLVNFFPLGWPVQPPQPPHPRPERSGSISTGDQGIEAPFVPPPILSPYAIDIYTHVRYRRAIDPFREWHDPLQPLVNFFPAGWEVAPVQPPKPRPERSGSIAASESGVELPFAPPPPPTTYVFDFANHPRRPRPERAGALARGTEAADEPFVGWVNQGWPLTDAPQRPRPRVFGAIQAQWNIERVTPPPPPLTAYVTLADLVIHKRVKYPSGAMPFEYGWALPHFVSVWFATTIVSQASGITTVTAASSQTVVKGEQTGR